MYVHIRSVFELQAYEIKVCMYKARRQNKDDADLYISTTNLYTINIRLKKKEEKK